MQTVNSLQLQLLHKIIIKATEPNFYRFSSLTKIPTHTPNALFFNYLIETLNLSNTEAQSISNSPRFSNIKSLENPQSVLDYFRSVGLSETEIRSSVLFQPRILLSDVDRILKPKIEFFQEMGLLANHNEPRKEIVKEHAFLESCGIVGSQLSFLLKARHMIFVMEESELRDLVSRVLNLGFSVNSRIFVYGLAVVSGLSKETFDRKLELIRSFGFTKHEVMEMFQKQPTMLGKSEEQLKVMQILKSKRLLKKEPSFVSVLKLCEEEFLDKYVARFTDDAQELLVAYKGHLLDSSFFPSSSDDKNLDAS
ncbi:hypothetical protein JRO89_XS08G0020400 [Xanthoceras sorbifolium]|uniref:Uncharacterized protein n=1 Tax=Xanthoceras sorbifolium TaxID=99658 RepID=A0ABQ8HN73_9ROSI|nr:hypothetical protein JRO89_XS08G0020400 [Xanthoceras sorbifolium]